MKTVKIKAYEYDELSPAAQEMARDWWRKANSESGETFWSESVIDDFCKLAGFLGWSVDSKRVYWSGFWSQGDGACFEGDFDSRNIDLAGLEQYAPAGPDALNAEIGGIGARIKAACDGRLVQGHSKHNDRYCHSRSIDLDFWSCDDNGEEESLPDGARESLEEETRDLCDWLYAALEREYEWMMADEQIAETIRANEYLFDECGKRSVIL